MPIGSSRDPSALARLRRVGGDDLALAIVGMFLSSAPERLSAMRQGQRDRDYELVERIAHSLKACAGNVGAGALQRLAGELERLARERQEHALAVLLPDADGAFEAVRRELVIELQELSA